jgi:hypothetical protein
LKEFIDLIGTRTRDLPALQYSASTTTLPRVPKLNIQNCETVISPVRLYGRKTVAMSREEHRLGVFQNRRDFRNKSMCHLGGRRFMCTSERKRPQRRPRYRWEGNIKMEQVGMICTGLIWFRMGTGGVLL